MADAATGPRSPRPIDAPLVGVTPLVVLALAAFALSARADSDAIRIGVLGVALFVTMAHHGAVLVRAWRAGVRASTIGTFVLCAVGAVLLVRAPAAIDGAFTGLAVLLAGHLALQAYRVAWLAGQGPGSPGRRPVLLVAHVALAAAMILVVQTGPTAPLSWRVGISPMASGVALGGLAAVALGLVGIASRDVSGWARWGLPLQLVGLFAGLFAVLFAETNVVGTSVGGSAGADAVALLIGPLGVAHGLQGLLLTFQVEARAASVARRPFDGIAWVGLAVVLGAGLSLAVPWGTSRALGIDPRTVLLAAQGAFALHHVLVDGVAFRLGDGRWWRPLVDGVAPARPDRARVSNGVAVGAALAGALVLVMAMFGVTGVLLARPGASERELGLADRIHPHDAGVTIAFARSLLDEGDARAAAEVLRVLVDRGAYAPDAHRLLLSICARRPRALPDCLARVPAVLAEDAAVGAVRAEVALGAGDLSEAKAAAHAAYARDPRDPYVLAVLGRVLEADDARGPARDHLDAGLRARERLGPRRVKRADAEGSPVERPFDPLIDDPRLLRAGIAQARLMAAEKRHEMAVAVLERVLEGAVAHDDPDAALLALAVRAQVFEEKDDAREALSSYQRALRVAPFAEEPAAEARAWIDYATLLTRSGASLEARYACVLKAARALEGLDASRANHRTLAERVDRGREELEAALAPSAAESVRADLERAADEALSLAYPAQEALLEAAGGP